VAFGGRAVALASVVRRFPALSCAAFGSLIIFEVSSWLPQK
jgi:hypothetical protein